MNASELAKTVVEAIKDRKADDALAAQVAEDFAKLDPMAMYHFVVQVAGSLKESKEHKDGLATFNTLLTKHAPFVEAMSRLNDAKAKGELAKPA